MGASIAIDGFGWVLRIGGTPLPVGELTNISFPSATKDVFDSSHSGSPSHHRSGKAGFKDAGEVSVEMNYTQEDFEVLKAAFDSEAVLELAIILTDDNFTNTDPRWDFAGFLTGPPIEAPFDDKVTLSVTFKVTGAPVFTPGTNAPEVVYDSWTDPNGTLIENHTSDSGHTYTETPGGALEIQSGALVKDGSYTIDGITDTGGTYEFVLLWGAGGIFSVHRGPDADNGYRLQWGPGYLRLMRVVATVETLVDSASGALVVNGATFLWDVSADGGTHLFYVNAVEQMNYVDGSPLGLGVFRPTALAGTDTGIDEMELTLL